MYSVFHHKCLAALSSLMLVGAPAAFAADWPERPVTLVVPQGTGSGSDIISRLLANHMAPSLGQPVVVANRPGAGGIVGHQSVLQDDPDGYTMLFSSTAPLLIIPELNDSAQYSIDDFLPVAPVLNAPFVLLVDDDEDSPNSVAELVERLKSGEEAFASTGLGAMTHLGSEMFLQRAGVEATHVPYRGSSAAITDLMAGRVLFAIDSLTASTRHIQPGQLRALAVTGDERVDSLPDVPTLAEAGYPGVPIGVLGGIFARNDVPTEAVAAVQSAVADALADPDLIQRFEELQTHILQMSSDEFAESFKAQAPVWKDTIQQLDIQVQ